MTQEELLKKEKKASEILSRLDTDFDMSRREEMTLRSELAGLLEEIHSSRAEELLTEALASVMPSCEKTKEEGMYETEIYASYDDTLEVSTIKEIVESEYPEDEFQDMMESWYQDSAEDKLAGIINEVEQYLQDKGVDLDYVKDDQVEDYVKTHVCVKLPYDRYLAQDVEATIILDTGDLNYEFRINCHFPCNSLYAIPRPPQEGEEGYVPYDTENYIDPKSGLVWLAKSQGYSSKELHLALVNYNLIPDEKIEALCFDKLSSKPTFFESLWWEMVNCPSSGPCVTFLVAMSFKEFLKLNDILRERDRNGYIYSPEKRPDCGTIRLSKDTVTGLYDNFTGGGSLAGFSIALEKDIELPIKYIGVAAPSIKNCKGNQFDVKETYGFTSSVWEKTLLGIDLPQNQTKEVVS